MMIKPAPKMIRIFGITLFILVVSLCAASFSFSQRGGADNELEEFDFANGLFSRGMYDMAIKGYEDFLKSYPGSRYAESANYRIGESYFLDKKYDEALNRFNMFGKRYPSGDLAGKAVLRKGQIYYLKGDYEQAERILSGLAGKGGTDDVVVQARYYEAGIYFKRGDYTTARDMLEDLVSAAKDNKFISFAYLNLGDIYAAIKDYSGAAEAYRNAGLSAADEGLAAQAELRAGNAYYMDGDYAKAESFYGKVIARPSEQEISESAALGLLSALYKKGEYGRIIEKSDELLTRVKSDTSRSQALFIKGNSYFHEDRFREAEKAFNEASRMYPSTEYGVKSGLNECWTLYKMGEFEKCLSSADSYVSRSRESMDEVLYVKAKALFELGRTQDAVRVYKGIAKDFPDAAFHKEALYELGRLYSSSGEPEKAFEYYYRFVNEYPGDTRAPEVLLRAGQENLKLKRYKEADRDYNDFLSRFSDSPLKENVLYQLGRVYIEQENYDKAIEVYKRFVKEFPRSKVRASATYWMGRGYQERQQWDEAIKVYSGLTADADGELYGRAMESMAYSCFQKGDYDRAAGVYFDLMNRTKDIKLVDGVYRWVADYYLNEGESGKSLSVLAIFEKKYPVLAAGGEISYMFGENYGRMGNWEESVSYFQKTLKTGVSSPYLERSYLGLGRAYAAKGEHSKALEFLEKALKDREDNITGAFSRFEIGNVNFEMMNYEEAAKQYLMVAILYEEEDLCSKALFRAGISFNKAALPERSVEAFKELIKRYPDNSLSMKAKGQIERIESEKG